MRNFFNLFSGLCFLTLLVPGFLQADESEKYEFKIDTGVLSGFTHGPNALQFVRKKMAVLIKTENALTTANRSTATMQGLMFCQYRSPKTVIDLELHAKIEKQQIETNYTPSQIDAIVYEWEELYGAPVPLKGLRPQTKRLTFHEGEGFHFDYALKRNFEYLLTLKIAYDENQKKLQNLIPDLIEIKKFITSIEGDFRGRVILENNKSGLPPFIFFEQETDGGRFIHLHHPMHDIRYNRDTKTFDTAYSDDIASVAKLPEIKRLLTDSDVRKFVFEQTEPIQVRVEGNPAAGFSFLFIRVNSGATLKGRLEAREIKVF